MSGVLAGARFQVVITRQYAESLIPLIIAPLYTLIFVTLLRHGGRPDLSGYALIGPAFSRVQSDKTKTELLIFLTPHVAIQPETLKAMSQDEMRGTKLTPNAVDAGVFQDHIQGL